MGLELADTSAWTSRQRNPAVSHDFETRLLQGEIATCPMVTLELLWEAQDATRFQHRRERWKRSSSFRSTSARGDGPRTSSSGSPRTGRSTTAA